MNLEERIASLHTSYQSMQPMFQDIGKKIGPNRVWLDAGSGEGILSLWIAHDIKAGITILVDVDSPIVPLPPQTFFYRYNIESTEFVQRFQNKVQVVMSLSVLHECRNPATAFSNLISVLPMGGIAFIFDYSEEGWSSQRDIAAQSKASVRQHFLADVANAGQYGLLTDTGIKHYWEDHIFPRVPGDCVLRFNGHLYSITYLPRQWGEVKEPPPDIRAHLEALGWKPPN